MPLYWNNKNDKSEKFAAVLNSVYLDYYYCYFLIDILHYFLIMICLILFSLNDKNNNEFVLCYN